MEENEHTKSWLLPSAVVGVSIIIAAYVVRPPGGTYEELTKAVEDIGDRISTLSHSVGRIGESKIGEFGGGGKVLMITYANGEKETFDRYTYVIVQRDHVVIHMPEKGEAVNGARRMRLIPLAAVRSIEQGSAPLEPHEVE